MDLAANFDSVHQRIQAACGRAGRDPGSVLVVAVSKGQPPERVRAAAMFGQAIFGESRVQEAKAKIEQCPGHLRWHLIGHLQSNKCRDAVELFERIESVDGLPLAQEISKSTNKQATTMHVLLEVNVAGDANQFGLNPDQSVATLSE